MRADNDSFTISGNGSSPGFAVKYYAGLSGSSDITAAVAGGTYVINNLSPGAAQYFRMMLTPAKNTSAGAVLDSGIAVLSNANSTRIDVVIAQTSVRR